jgi:hypothetical protein
MYSIGVGNTGCKLAYLLNKDSLLFSTADQDTNNFAASKNLFSISGDGASKRFRTGIKIWEEKEKEVEEIIKDIADDKVVIFSSLGGGSGSSSLAMFSKILLKNRNKILIVGVLPFVKENNPPLANAVQSVNNLMPFLNDVSVILFNNESLLKKYQGDWGDMNHHIVSRVDYVLNLLNKYNSKDYSPMTLDQSELTSVVFGGGFLDISDSFVEEGKIDFEFGSLDKETKNCLVCMFVDKDIKEKTKVDYHQTILTNEIMKIGRKVLNARLIPGILRAPVNYSNSKDESIKDRCYLTIASGLSVDKYFRALNKLRDAAVKKATVFSEKSKFDKVLDKKETKLLDI